MADVLLVLGRHPLVVALDRRQVGGDARREGNTSVQPPRRPRQGVERDLEQAR